MAKNLIVFKTKSFPNTSETFIVHGIIAAIQGGYEVKIIVNSKNPIEASSQIELLREYDLMNKLSIADIHQRRFRYIKALLLLLNPVLCYFFIKYCLASRKWTFTNLFELAFYKKFRRANKFHVHFAYSLEPLLFLKKIDFIKSKIIVTFHGYDAHYISEEKLTNLIEDFKNYVANITVNSEYLKNKLIKKGFEPTLIEKIPIGIDCNFFSNELNEEIPTNPLRLITVGRFIELKGQHLGIMAVSKLIDKEYDVTYTLVGEGKELKNLKSLINELGIDKFVRIIGPKSQSEIKNLLAAHHIFLMTSTKDRDQRREAFGVVSLEAQSMGLPVVGFESGGFPETIIDTKTGFAIQDGDVDKFVEKLELLISDTVVRNNMAKAAKIHIHDSFDITKMSKQYLRLYEDEV